MTMKYVACLVIGMKLLSPVLCKAEAFGFKTITMTPVGCIPGNDGVLAITVTRPQDGVEYRLVRNPGGIVVGEQENDGTFTGLRAVDAQGAPFSYDIIARNLTTNQEILAGMRVGTPIPLSINTTIITHVSTPGGNDGAISVSVTGGRPPYSYFIKVPSIPNEIPSTTGPNFSNLVAGLYTIRVASTDGCPGDTVTVIVVEPTT